MRNYIVAFLCFFLAVFTLHCNKKDAPSMNTGIVYKSGNIGAEIPQEKSSETNIQQLQNKLKSMSSAELFQFALDCWNKGRYSDALTAYNKILETDKNYPDLYYHLGLLYRDMSMADEAICAFQTALVQNPDSAESHCNLGYAYRYKGLHNEAVAEYKKSLALLPESKTKQKANIHYNLGFSYFSGGLIDDSINEFKTALAYKPNDKEIHQKLGIAYTSKGWLDKAKEEFTLSKEYIASGQKEPD
jgi:tetratricopeptide (TPR) repeat protein